jgi:hypothetical protein
MIVGGPQSSLCNRGSDDAIDLRFNYGGLPPVEQIQLGPNRIDADYRVTLG